MRKKKLNIAEQIEYMEYQGVKFSKDLCSIDKAKDFLENSNYYFKITFFYELYDFEYDEKQNKQYKNLEFAYLRELSIMDSTLRNIILEITLTIEHLLKVSLNRHFCNNESEDGYQIVEQYLQKKRAPKVFDIFNRDRSKINIYTRDILEKYYPHDFALWNFIEILTFSEFISFLKFYNEKYEMENFNPTIYSLLFNTNLLRNIAAHNTCVLNKIKTKDQTFKPTKRLFSYANRLKLGFTSKEIKSFYENPLIHDYLSILLVYNTLCSGKMRKKSTEKILLLLERFAKHKDYFQKDKILYKNIDFMIKITKNILTQSIC